MYTCSASSFSSQSADFFSQTSLRNGSTLSMVQLLFIIQEYRSEP
jgi:hypothetical protein